ncbi:MAG: bifunctional transaldolase/phosoglucose isomerase [bacterium]
MKPNPLLRLAQLGQSIWLDFLRRKFIESGDLKKLIEEDGLRGVTSNPTIFEKSIGGSSDYDEDIRLLARQGRGAGEIYEHLAVADIRAATDLFRPLHDKLEGRDGFVSLEVSPLLARDTRATIEEARRLWAAIGRPNAFIKIPGTREGLPAVRACIRQGININVTLLFGLPRYREVAEAYLAGLEERARDGQPLDHVSSVASFFLSRIDNLVDPVLEKKVQEGGGKAELAAGLRGEVAVASARLAFQIYKEIFGGDRFRALAAKGARPQRVLWASTSTKNPSYSDVKYVEALIGPDTVNTVPLETLNAYRDHGDPAPRLEQDVEKAESVLRRLPEVGIDIDQVTRTLEDDGVEKFRQPFERLMTLLEAKRAAALAGPAQRQDLHFGDYRGAIEERLRQLEAQQFVSRLWRKDPSLWKSDPAEQQSIRRGLGWLHLPEKMMDCLPDLRAFTAEVKSAGFRHVVHMGMGGSSLTPILFERAFGPRKEGLPLTVLDTTDAATIREIERNVPPDAALFIVASKSGTTTEPLAFGEYFYARLRQAKGEAAGDHFVAVTDPGTPLEKLARERRYRRAFLSFPDVGGRYSAFSYFGLVPAALMGLDLAELLERALRMLHACGHCVPAGENPGVILGAAMAELARAGRDKVTFLLPDAIVPLGLWLEQLLAESTGKEGKGLVPVAGEPPAEPAVYGGDRFFVYLRLEEGDNGWLDERAEDLRRAGHPLAVLRLEDRFDLAQELFRWQVATATAGSVLGVDAFDQPNVQESKENARRLLDEVRKSGRLPEEKPTHAEQGLTLYGGEGGPNLKEALKGFLGRRRPGDYVALLAYVTENDEVERALQATRRRLRDTLHVATTFGYGPRYLHSTGQLHKGGPDKGLFLELTAAADADIGIPGQRIGFDLLKQAQAIGDFEALRRHGRRVLRIHLGPDIRRGLAALDKAVAEALG